jgi:hypothetical protein
MSEKCDPDLAADSRSGWALASHVCLACLGRVLERAGDNGREFRCSNCEATWNDTVTKGCACGLRLGNRDAGVRCVSNPRPRPESPWVIVAAEVA